MKADKLLRRAGLYLLVGVIVMYSVFPFYYAVITSLRSGSAIFSTSIVPSAIGLDNYAATFAEQPFARNIANSVVVSSVVVARRTSDVSPASLARRMNTWRGPSTQSSASHRPSSRSHRVQR